MKIIISFLFIFFIKIYFGQNINQVAQEFWKSVDQNDNNEIIKNGEKIIDFTVKENYFDSTIIEIRLLTANSYNNLYKYENSLKLDLSTLELMKVYSSEDNFRYLTVLNNIAGDYMNLSLYSKALEYHNKILDVYKTKYDDKDPRFAIYLSNLALNYVYLGNYSKALKLNLDALSINEKFYGKDSPELITSLVNTAQNYSKLGNYKKALEYDKRALSIGQKTIGESHPNYINILRCISKDYGQLGNYKDALKYILISIDLTEKNLGENSLDYAISVSNLASYYYNIDELHLALKYYKKSINIFDDIVGQEHSDYARILNDIALIYSDLGEYNRAQELYFQALKTYINTVGEESSGYATCLSNLALNYSYKAEYNNSLEYNLKTLKIKEKIYGEEHPVYALSLINIGQNYLELGNNNLSFNYFQQALKINEKKFGNTHEKYANALYALAGFYFKTGDFKKSLEYNFNALKIYNDSDLPRSLKYAAILNNIALNQDKLGEYKNALNFNKKALKIRKKNKNYPSYCVSLNNIAVNYDHIGKNKKALKYDFKALKLKEGLYGSLTPSIAISHSNISHSFFSIGNIKEATNHANLSTEIYLSNFKKNQFGLSESTLISYKKELEKSYQFSANILLFYNEFVSQLYDQWININGILNYNRKLIVDEITNNEDTSQINNLNVIIENQTLLNRYNELTIKEKQNRITNTIELENEIENRMKLLSEKISNFYDFKRKLKSNDIVKYLNNNEFFIDITSIRKYDFKKDRESDSLIYLVFISNSKDSLVNYVFLENGTRIDEEIYYNYKEQATDFNNKTDLKSSNFYNYFWKPIADKIGDAKTIYVSLGGVYNNLNLNTIYNPETGKYLLEEKDIRIVNSARDFVLNKERLKQNYTSNTASLYGFANFDGNTTLSADSTDFFASTRDINPVLLDSMTRGGLKVKILPATKIEVETISKSLKNNGWIVSNYLDDNASETNIKKEASPRILHIATHGYFFKDIPIENDNNRFLGMERKQVVQDPMLRSGLLLTGANKTLKGEKTNGENGLLSAAEASLLDLRETELVVLSACETGKGEIKNSEGVYGLRKAFADAGAQNIIMSLWKVDDKVTQEFMSRFYQIWLNDKTSIREAFNKTQLEIKAKYPQPYYWGAFILVGE